MNISSIEKKILKSTLKGEVGRWIKISLKSDISYLLKEITSDTKNLVLRWQKVIQKLKRSLHVEERGKYKNIPHWQKGGFSERMKNDNFCQINKQIFYRLW